jgi:hypothetical protein
VSDRFDAARAVADAVLFEGYVLYPYRASAPKNQIRWQWGVLFPRAFAEADGSERWRNRTECVVDPGSSPRLTVRVRGLHVQHRSVEVDGAPVSEVHVDGVPWVPWDEAVEWEVDLPAVPLLPLQGATHGSSWRCPAARSGSHSERRRHRVRRPGAPPRADRRRRERRRRVGGRQRCAREGHRGGRERGAGDGRYDDA